MKPHNLLLTLLLLSCTGTQKVNYDDLLFELYSYGENAILILETKSVEDVAFIEANYQLADAFNGHFVDPTYPGTYFFEIEMDDLELTYSDKFNGGYVIPRRLLKDISVYLTVPVTSHGKIVTSNGNPVGRDRQVR